MKYRNASNRRLWVRRAGVTVDPGETFESASPVNDANFVEVKNEKKDAGNAPAKED